jgi:hypothetical protein
MSSECPGTTTASEYSDLEIASTNEVTAGTRTEVRGSHVDDDRQCLQCCGALKKARSDATFCGQRCRRRFVRSGRSSNYHEPPRSSTAAGPGVLAEMRADTEFRRQLEQHVEASQPLSRAERQLLSRQRANPGVLLPELAQLQLDRAIEQQRREAAEYAARQPLRPEDPRDPSSLGSVARRARYDRTRNRPADPHLSILRPLDRHPGPHPWDDEPECITAPWSRGRW